MLECRHDEVFAAAPNMHLIVAAFFFFVSRRLAARTVAGFVVVFLVSRMPVIVLVVLVDVDGGWLDRLAAAGRGRGAWPLGAAAACAVPAADDRLGLCKA